MKVTVVGLGPGANSDMTIRAYNAVKQADVVVGYTVYIDLIKDEFPDKQFLSTGMRKEVDRCKMALETALQGKNVAMVCSGDSGVYGMAGLMYELSEEYDNIEIEVVPGITAACAGASVLGAPLTHDFAVISLSDLLTPWEKIEKRLETAAQGDFVIAIYNPRSNNRPDYLKKACEILLKFKRSDTVCGYVKNIGRQGEYSVVLSLEELKDNTDVDMFTTVFIGSDSTKIIKGKMVTPRGYYL